MQIIKAQPEVVEQIKQSLIDNQADSACIRIVRRLELVENAIPEGFAMYQSEITLNDHVQEFDGINIIVANILVDLFGGFTLGIKEGTHKTEILITPDREKPTVKRGKAS